MARLMLATTAALLAVWPGWSRAEVVQERGVRLSVQADLAPAALPRKGEVPVSISFAGKIGAASGTVLPQLERVAISINSHGRARTKGLPRCRYGHISPSTTTEALAACRGSLVGRGHFSADVRLPEQSPFPSEGDVLAFNARYKGSPAIFVHIYGTEPVPTSYVLPLLVRNSRGTYGTVLEGTLPKVTGEWGFVTGISMDLHRNFSSNGRSYSYLSAGCPAPNGLSTALFPLAKTTFGFEGGPRITSVLDRQCRVARG